MILNVCAVIVCRVSDQLCCDCLLRARQDSLCCVVTACAYISDCLRSDCTLNDCALIVHVLIAVGLMTTL